VAGVSNLDQATAGTGIYANSQSDLEPPDQGLCVGTNSTTHATNVVEPVAADRHRRWPPLTADLGNKGRL
jgi:hypothetical protein